MFICCSHRFLVGISDWICCSYRQCWDLKVGGVYIVLGKQCTVNQSDNPTTRWIRFQANRFIGIQKGITRELIKYKNRSADILSSPKPTKQVQQPAGPITIVRHCRKQISSSPFIFRPDFFTHYSKELPPSFDSCVQIRMNLRSLRDECLRLKAELAQYRPSIAAQFII